MARTPSTMLDLGTRAPDFSLPDVTQDDSVVSRSQFAGSPLLVMFICNHCPFVIHVRDELAKVGAKAKELGVGVVAISSNDVEKYPADSPEKMREEAQSAGYGFPYLYDESQSVAKAYTAACTPDFFLFDADHSLVYRGQLDDSRPGNDHPVNGKDLRAALDAAAAGSPASADQRPSIGCNIKWKPGNEPPYFG